MKGLLTNLRVMVMVFIVLLLLAMSVQALPGDPPVIDSIDVNPDNPTDYNDLTCTVSLSDSDGDMDYVDFRWYVNGILRKENTQLVYGSSDTASDTLNALYTGDNDYVVCQARAYDFEGGYAFASHAVRVGTTPANSMPTISYVDITPRHPNPQQDLTCSVLATDADDNLDYVSFRWERNGRTVRSASKDMEGSSDSETDTLNSGYTNPGDRISCLASVYDTDGARDSEYSTPVLISGEQPSPYPPYPPSPYNKKPLAILTVNNYYTDTDEMVYFSGSRSYDPDGFVLQYKFDYGDGEQTAWLPNSSPYSYHSYSERGTYYAMVKVKDNEYFESEWSNPVLIRVGREGYAYDGYGHDPEIEDMDIRVKQRAGYVEFRCEVDVYDRDDDLDYVRFKWYVDGELFSKDKEYVSGDEDEADSRLNLAFEDEEDEDYYNVKCTATVYDEERNYDSASKTTRGYPPEGEECEITVNRFDYNSYLTEGDNGWVEIETENTGERSGTLTIELYVDGSLKNSYETHLSTEEEVEKRFEFPLSVGDHNIRVEAYLPCGGRVTKFTEMTVFPASSQVFIPQEEEGEEIAGTSVTFSPKSLDVEINSGKTLEIVIQTSEVSEFSISVEGIPGNWTNYPDEVEVEGSEKVHVYIVPKEVGSYEFTVKVETDGETFEEDINLYVSPESEEEEEINGITGLITFAEGNWLIGLAIVSVLVLIFAVYMITGRFKRKTYEEHVYGGSYSPRMIAEN